MDTALLVMDVQNGVVQRYPDSATMLDRLGRAVAAARVSAVDVVFVRVAFRPGYPEVSGRNRMFRALAERGSAGLVEGGDAAAFHATVAPGPDDIVVTKRRVSAFAGSDLETVLRARGVRHLALAGIATSGVVLSTLRQAADMDYELTVLADACVDADTDVHRVLLDKVFPRQAEVLSVEQWASRLPAGWR